MATEWHEINGYRVSFDVRSDASRFIICRGAECVGKGLIDGELGPGIVWDPLRLEQIAAGLPTFEVLRVAYEMLEHWARMRDRLQRKGLGDG